MIHTIRLDNKKLVTDFSTEPQIGDILQRDDNSFVRIGNLKSLVQNFEQYITIEDSPRNIDHTNEDGTIATFDANAEVPYIAKGDLVLDFRKEHSRFVTLKNVVIEELDLLAIGNDTIEAILKKNNLNKPLIRNRIFFVSCVLRAASGVYVYSGSKNNRVVLRANGNFPINSIPVAAEGNLSVAWSKNTAQKIISNHPIRCIFQAVSKRPMGWEILG